MPLVVQDAAPHIVRITLDNQSKRNAMSREMMAELANLWDRLEATADCRAIVITGAGEKGFCAGADIGGDLTAGPEIVRAVNRVFSFQPADIIDQLNLRRPIYSLTTNYGHFGKKGLSWEAIDKVKALHKAL